MHNMCVICVWRACRGALVHNMCAICVWRACMSALVHSMFVVCMWRERRGALVHDMCLALWRACRVRLCRAYVTVLHVCYG